MRERERERESCEMFISLSVKQVIFFQGFSENRLVVNTALIRACVVCEVVNLTNKIPFLDVYGDINLVGHVIKSHKARRALWKCSSSDNQILY